MRTHEAKPSPAARRRRRRLRATSDVVVVLSIVASSVVACSSENFGVDPGFGPGTDATGWQFTPEDGAVGESPLDAGPSGGGQPDVDDRTQDAAPSDAVPFDAEPSDVVPFDAEPSDAAPLDAGPPTDVGGISDAGPAMDADPAIDAGPAIDTGPAMDADPAIDAGQGQDAGAPDGGPVCALPCADDNACPGDPQQPCMEGACVAGCCGLVAVPVGSPCDDGVACTTGDGCDAQGACSGVANVCDDGLNCTNDSCDPVTGACVHAPVVGTCAIDGACWFVDQAKPGSPCQRCKPAENPLGWSAQPGCCAQDSDCPANGVCDQPVCNPATGMCSVQQKLGCCVADSQCNDNNACTIDACDQQTGKCQIAPVPCGAPSACELGVCDPQNGQCVGQLQPGYCKIAGQCVLAGSSAPGDPCQVCDPAQNALGWTAAVGKPCDDGQLCTDGDACTAFGTCKGNVQPGCCQADVDCPPSPSSCEIPFCDKALNACSVIEKNGCCEAGVCCDLFAKVPKSAGTKCSDNVVATEYQCAGQQVMVRETHPGCDGSSPTVCASNPIYAVKGPWMTLQTCGPNTVCTEQGSGIQPTCEPTVLAGSCSGSCGGGSASGPCSCAPGCNNTGTCCADYQALCGCTVGACCDIALQYPLPAGTPCGSMNFDVQYQCVGQQIQLREGGQTCNGQNVCSGAAADLSWGPWQNGQLCPSGTQCTVAASGKSASCEPISVAGSCAGQCGGKGSGSCWCDTACKGLDDCCSDYGVQCGSCFGRCGDYTPSASCQCDAACTSIGDCCADKSETCP